MAYTAVFVERMIVGIELLPITVEIAAVVAGNFLPQDEHFCALWSNDVEVEFESRLLFVFENLKTEARLGFL